VFSRPVWNHAQVLILGTILARGKRTVTSALRAVGLAQETHFTNYHRVLNRTVWHVWFAAKVLLGLLVALLPPQVPLLVAVDETIERRKGLKIKTKGASAQCRSARWFPFLTAKSYKSTKSESDQKWQQLTKP